MKPLANRIEKLEKRTRRRPKGYIVKKSDETLNQAAERTRIQEGLLPEEFYGQCKFGSSDKFVGYQHATLG